ncbi:MAG TPA: 4Fe-4S binding protein [Rectinemataceae bacterium]|nr:4Fe-4S binding protein [Rectinemataceae bacterium]
MMILLRLLFAIMVASFASFGASFLSSAWRRRRKADAAAMAVEGLLPGFDCGLCGAEDCRSYSIDIATKGADPGLCSPGGMRTESRIRSYLGESRGDGRAVRRLASILCAGDDKVAARDFEYDGQDDCLAAAALYGGPKRCKDGCLGFGTCARVCPLGAIRMEDGLARVDPGLCTGCGLCVPVCPNSIIVLRPESERWRVACSSHREPEAKAADCRKACIACGECVKNSFQGEFRLEKNLASTRPVENGQWELIAPVCPTGAIADRDMRKKTRSSLRNQEH